MKITKAKDRDLFYTWVELPREPWQERKRKKVYGKSREECKKKATDLMHDIQTNQYAEPNKLTVKSFLETWFKNHSVKLTPYTRDGYKNNIFNHIIPEIGNIPLQKLTALQIETFYADKMKDKVVDGKTIKRLSETSVSYIHRVLNLALKYAKSKKIIPYNPMEDVTAPKPRTPYIDVYNKTQLVDFLDAIKGDEMEVAVNIAIGLGMRRGEILGLQWDAIELDTGKLSITTELIYDTEKKTLDLKEPKTEKGFRIIYVPEYLLGLLKLHKQLQENNKNDYSDYEDNNLVICQKDGNPYIPGTYSHKFERLLKKHNFTHTTLHGLRHAYATLHSRYNTSLKTLADTLGHSDVSITGNMYQSTLDDMKKEVAAKTNEILYKELVKNEKTKE